ncbi:hypothetical protein V2J09_001525 [Rumex salicifolius]
MKTSNPNPKLILVIISFLLLVALSSSSPPEEPIKCKNPTKNTDCTLTNSYGTFPDRSTCSAAQAVYPRSESELAEAVAGAVKKGQKIKVATRYVHSIPQLGCPDGDHAGLLVSTKHLDKTVSVDRIGQTMTVESGMTLEQLIKEAAAVGLALPYAPYWWGVTVGGMLGTGAHGSSLWGKGSGVHEYVVRVRIVSPGSAQDGFVNIREVDETNQEELDAVKVSLGVLGVISQVTLKLQPMFKRSVTYEKTDDHDLADQAVTFGNQHEFADMTWYPSQRKVLYRKDDRVAINISGDGLNDFIGFRATATLALATVRIAEESKEATGNGEGKCIDSKLTTSLLKTTGFGLTNNGFLFTGYPVIGFQNRLQASGTCLDGPEDALITACPWDPRVKSQFFHQSTFSVPLPNVKSFILDIQKLVDLEPKSMCGLELYNGILMRYVKGSSAYLGKEADALDFDITYYRSKDPLEPRLYEDIFEEVEQMGLFKYGGMPHWGKNRNLAFDGVIKKYGKASEFLKVKDKYDPTGLFSSLWTDQVLGLQSGITTDKEGCALEGMCICSQDIHCAPHKGYVCSPGKIYKEARNKKIKFNIVSGQSSSNLRLGVDEFLKTPFELLQSNSPIALNIQLPDIAIISHRGLSTSATTTVNRRGFLLLYRLQLLASPSSSLLKRQQHLRSAQFPLFLLRLPTLLLNRLFSLLRNLPLSLAKIVGGN